MFFDCLKRKVLFVCFCVDWKCKMAAGHSLTYDTMELF